MAMIASLAHIRQNHHRGSPLGLLGSHDEKNGRFTPFEVTLAAAVAGEDEAAQFTACGMSRLARCQLL